MMTKFSALIRLSIRLALLCFALAGACRAADNLNMMTEDYAPLNFAENGRLQGVSVDLMEEMLQIAGYSQTRADMLLMPWARAYTHVQQSRNAVLFAMTRTEHRDGLFKWVGPIIPSHIVITARRDKSLRVASLQDLKTLRIATVRDDIGEQLLLNNGVPDSALRRTSSPQVALAMLSLGQVDAWAYGRLGAAWYIKQMKLKPADYEEIFTLKDSDQYFAFSLQTPDEIVQRFQQALDQLKNNGRHQAIVNKYVEGAL
ncbi:transporter substrate-binding domain-containing protein [Hahella aquimaris]|uniref:substrate-binding periplasmic protein n=1 Tax=Hahella sp. HNIBRBA332 TaxID=3015983 RepID=UPI00273C7A5B|nr:transporter substrate-binding domain-containing protein [Hahella sp. HNIBRBA332]WLQ13347.1 transporter substrate-binding domain-containing protein [Hahella sp. HNIBRBA332]